MTNVSSKLSNQDLVLLAKKNYENSQRALTPGTIVTLPSNGLIYPESSILRKNSIEMRYMTAYDEDILSNNAYLKQGIVFKKLLESLIITPGVHPDDLATFDQDKLIISARIHAYGSTYPVTVTDPKTGSTLSRNVELENLQHKSFTLVPDKNGEFNYTSQDNNIQLKFKFITEKESALIDETNAISKLMELSITEVNGIRDTAKIAQFIKFEMRAIDAKNFRTYLTTNMPGINYNVQFEGEDGGTFDASFRMQPDLFWF